MNIEEHSYTITTSTTYKFNYFQIQTISVSSETTINVQVQLYYIEPIPTPMVGSTMVNQLNISIGSDEYSKFTPSDLYKYIAEYLLAL